MRSWHVVPASAVIAAVVTFALGAGTGATICAAFAAAAIAHATRALISGTLGTLATPVAIVTAAVASQLAVLAIVDRGLSIEAVPVSRGLLAFAALAWTLAELARPSSVPLVALVPATVATILDPGCAGLIAIAGARLPGPVSFRIAAPIVGGLVAMCSIVAGVARDGAIARLGERWYGGPPHASAAGGSLGLLADAVGPLLAVAALAGFTMVARGHRASFAIAVCLAGALLVDLRAGTPGSTTLGLAALCGAIAVGRFAATIPIASGQVIVGATCAALLMLPPAWSATEAAIARARGSIAPSSP